MSNKTLLSILVILVLVTTGNAVGLIMSYRQHRKTVVVDVMRVANEFKLKRDLEGRVAAKFNAYAANLDSMQAVYKILVTRHAPEEATKQAAAQIDTMRAIAQSAYTTSNQRINEQLWQRLNALLDEYGEKYGYTLVIGANGMGTVLYNKKDLDKTDELIKFINEKYESGR